MYPDMAQYEPATPVSQLSNDAIIIRLLYTVNHLSRWLSAIHQEVKLQRSPSRDVPSVKDVVLAMRDDELRNFPRLYLMAVEDKPDLDRLPPVDRSEADRAWDRQAAVFEVMAEFRRLRQSTTSMLRSLPDDAWKRDGYSRLDHDLTIRQLAELMVLNDQRRLGELEVALERSGAREHIANVSRASLRELQRLAP